MKLTLNLGNKKNFKEQALINIDAVSPSVLRTQLAEKMNRSGGANAGVQLSICDTNAHVRSFRFENIALADIKNQLQTQAVELLGLPLEDIAIDFQILQTTPGHLNGIFLCISKKLLEEYIAVLDSFQYVAGKITAGIIDSLDHFFAAYNVKTQRFCFLDFSVKNLVGVAVFNQSECELIRNIPSDNIAQIKVEIIQSLRSAAAKSHVKKLDKIYISGESDSNHELFNELPKHFETTIECIPIKNHAHTKQNRESFFSLNLTKDFIVPLPLRQSIYRTIHLTFLGSAGLVLFLGCLIIFRQWTIHTTKSAYTTTEYSYALGLKYQVEKAK